MAKNIQGAAPGAPNSFLSVAFQVNPVNAEGELDLTTIEHAQGVIVGTIETEYDDEDQIIGKRFVNLKDGPALPIVGSVTGTVAVTNTVSVSPIASPNTSQSKETQYSSPTHQYAIFNSGNRNVALYVSSNTAEPIDIEVFVYAPPYLGNSPNSYLWKKFENVSTGSVLELGNFLGAHTSGDGNMFVKTTGAAFIVLVNY